MDEAGDAGEARAEGGCRRCKRLGVEVTAVLAGWARGSSSSSGKGAGGAPVVVIVIGETPGGHRVKLG